MTAFIRTKDLYARLTPKLVLRAHAAGWFKPLQSRSRFTIWSLADVARVEERLAAGEYPPMIPSEVLAEERRRQRVRAIKATATLQPAA
ncbi:hypothetical protein DB347_20880 [Opitutaceae bacterium EW11]|nr:hypothetical protein DB347_20880 [Opitutaceae bacterium EW11]